MTTTDKSWVLITGASSGLGEEFARQYAEQGHSLVLVARRLDRLQALAETLRRQYRIEVVEEQVDLSDIAAVVQLHRHLRKCGIAVDILINNAGHGLQGSFVDSQLDAALAMVRSCPAQRKINRRIRNPDFFSAGLLQRQRQFRQELDAGERLQRLHCQPVETLGEER